MAEWHELHITDKNGGQHFKVNASPLSTFPEIRNLQKHLKQAKEHPELYKFLDIETAFIVLDGEPYTI